MKTSRGDGWCVGGSREGWVCEMEACEKGRKKSRKFVSVIFEII